MTSESDSPAARPWNQRPHRLAVSPSPTQLALDIRDQLRVLIAELGIRAAAVRAERVLGEDILTIGQLSLTAARQLFGALREGAAGLMPGMVMWSVSRRELVQVVHVGEMHVSLQSVVIEARWIGMVSDLQPPNMHQITTALRARAARAYDPGPAA